MQKMKLPTGQAANDVNNLDRDFHDIKSLVTLELNVTLFR